MRFRKKLKDFMLIYTLLATLLPALLVCSVIAVLNKNYVKSDIKKNNVTIAKEIQAETSDYIHNSEELINQVNQMFGADGNTGLDKSSEYINALLKNNRYFEYLEITDENNVILSSYPENSNNIKLDNDYKVHDFNAKDIDKYGPKVYFPAYVSQSYGKRTALTVVRLGYRIYKGYFNFDTIKNITENPSINSKTIRAYLSDAKGNIISDNLANYFERDSNIDLISKNVEKENYVFEANYSKQKKLISAVRIPESGWYSVVTEDKKYAYSQLTLLNIILVAMMLISVILVNSCFNVIVKRILRIYRSFIAGIVKIIEGDYHSTMKISSYEEVNELSNYFNKMIEAVNSRENEIKKMAFSDQLTKLPNRKFFLEKLDGVLNENIEKTSVVFIDIDNFKFINDTFGHKVGDEMLIQFTKRLETVIKPNDLLARFGGDEFLILLENPIGKQEVEQWICSLNKLLILPFKIEDMKMDVSFSAGIACYPKDGKTSLELLKHAEMAMYFSKDEVKCSYKFYKEAMNLEVSNFMRIENAMRTAFEFNEFELYYQPQIDLGGNKLRGFEALIRCNSSELGYMSPVDFIPTLEKTGMIIEVGKWILEEACDKINELCSKNIEVLISVNVSSIQLMNGDFYQVVKDIISKKAINPKLLELEITETVLIKSYQDVLETLTKIKSLGIKLSIDDFGTGYSSLSYIRTLPVDTVKIDKSFINGLVTEKQDKNLTDIILLMAQKLNLTVVAEGVENNEQLEYLRNNNCDHAQGYYFGKPMTEKQMNEFIKNKFNEKLELSK